jgi:hypothetical protein
MLGRDLVEPVQRPVELLQVRPAELGPGRVVVLAVVQQQVTSSPEGGSGGFVAHCPMIPVAGRRAKAGSAGSEDSWIVLERVLQPAVAHWLTWIAGTNATPHGS